MSDDKRPMREGPMRNVALAVAQAVVNGIAADRDLFPTCLTCRFFNEPAAWCTQYGGHPPPRVLVYACGGYDDATIPPFE